MKPKYVRKRMGEAFFSIGPVIYNGRRHKSVLSYGDMDQVGKMWNTLTLAECKRLRDLLDKWAIPELERQLAAPAPKETDE